MLSLDLLGGALLIGGLCIAGLSYYCYNLHKRITATEDAYGILDEHNLQYINHLAALANHNGLKYPPTEKVTPAKTIPEKRTIVWEKLRK